MAWPSTARRPHSSARWASQTRTPGRISRGFFLADARKRKRTSRERRPAFRLGHVAAARRNARASSGKTLRCVNEGMLTSGETSIRRRREECSPRRASSRRCGNAFKRRGAVSCSNQRNKKPENPELTSLGKSSGIKSKDGLMKGRAQTSVGQRLSREETRASRFPISDGLVRRSFGEKAGESRIPPIRVRAQHPRRQPT